MALYISAIVQDKKSEHPLLKERGINNRTIATLNRINIFGRVTEHEVAYAGYVANIAVFLSATSLQKRIPITSDVSGHSDDLRRVSWRPILPTVSFASRRTLPEARQNAILSAFPDAGIDFTKSGQYTKVDINSPYPAVVDALKPLAAPFARNSNSEMSIHAWDSLNLLLILINEFLATNSYPAFHDIDGDKEDGNLEYLEVQNIPNVYQPVLHKDKVEKALAGLDEEDDDDDEMVLDFSSQTFGSMRDAVFTAKPSPLPPTNNYGPQSEIPALPGLFFPFFHRMITPDFSTIPKLVGRLFFRFLASTTSEAEEVYKELEKSWVSINNTDAGIVLAHVFFGISLSLQTQTRLFLVQTRDEYQGFCLLGGKFRVYDGSQFVAPVSNEELRDAVSNNASSHHAALNELANALSRKESATGLRVVPVETLTGAQIVMKEVSERTWDGEEKERLKVALGKLNFRRSYWPINHNTLRQALELVTTLAATPLLDAQFPGYAGQDIELYKERTYRVLSFFGPTSFSFINRAGKTFEIPSATDDDVATKKGSDGEDEPLKAIHVGIKKLSQANQDLKEVLEKGWIKVDQRERAGKYRNCVFSGKSRDEVWQALKVNVAPLLTKEVEVPEKAGKGKRRAKSDDFDEDEFFSNLTKRSRV